MNIGIVGLGLIGGSIGLKLQSLNHKVFGITNNNLNLQKAKERKLANIISNDYQILQNCRIVILALPIKDLLNPTKELIKAIPEKAILTDVGSVKEPVVEIWEKLHPFFIGSHPMAGTEKKGVNSGSLDLLNNAKWVLTPTNKTNLESLDLLSKLLETMGCHVYIESPIIHDRSVAFISHLPIYLASCLIETANGVNDKSLLKLSRKLASTGFLDTSRVGGGNPTLGVDLAKNNTKNILNALKEFKENLSELQNILENDHWDLLQAKLQNTKECRDYFCE